MSFRTQLSRDTHFRSSLLSYSWRQLAEGAATTTTTMLESFMNPPSYIAHMPWD